MSNQKIINIKPQVSIIIPVYNVEKYIEECVYSILEEREIDVEVVIVNDGSADGTLKIIQNLSSNDSRVKVISQENKGVTCARVTGLKNCSGDYVGFIDGDDYIKKGMLSYLYNLANKDSLDIILNQQFWRKSGNDESVMGGRLKEGIYIKDDETLDYVLNNLWNHKTGVGIQPNLACNLYKKELAQEIMYNMPSEVRFAEDEMFLFALITIATRVGIVNKPLYVYRLREGSVCNSSNKFFLRDINYKYLYLSEVFSNNKNADVLKRQLDSKTIHQICSFRFLKKGASEFHMFPYEKIPAGSNMIIYGAGQVGKSYYKQMCVNKYCNVVAWCDERYMDIKNDKVSNPDILKEKDKYEYVLVAVLDCAMGIDIKRKLQQKYSIDERIIITHEPASLVNFIET